MTDQLTQFCATAILCLSMTVAYAQESINAAGGEASGSGGAVSYSVGIMAYTTTIETGGSIAAGVQHAYEIFSVGIEENLHDFGLSVFPNPTVETLTLEVGNLNQKQLSYQLVDLQGKMLHSGAVQYAQTQLDFSALSAGAYFLHIRAEVQSIYTFKIIKN